MSFLRNGSNRLGRSLGKCFQRLTAGHLNCSPGSNCAAKFQPNFDSKRLKEISEKSKWLQRYRVYIPEKSNREFQGMSHKDKWYNTNCNIIMALGRAMGLHGDIIFEFLYALTLQNFGRVLNPQGHAWNSYHVPLSRVDTCDYYMGIFDCNGNLRNPYHPESLLKLLFVMQTLLKKDNNSENLTTLSPNPIPGFNCLNPEPKSLRLSKKIANRAGIGPESLARENGRRRRFRMGEKYRLEGFRGEVNPLLGGNTWSCYNKTVSQICNPLANKLGKSKNWKPSKSSQIVSNGIKKFCDKDTPLEKVKIPYISDKKERDRKIKRLDELLYGENNEFSRTGCDYLQINDEYGDSFRRKELMDLINSVNQQTLMQGDLNSIINALKYLDLKMAVKDETAIVKRMTHEISAEYNRLATKEQNLISNLDYKPKAHSENIKFGLPAKKLLPRQEKFVLPAKKPFPRQEKIVVPAKKSFPHQEKIVLPAKKAIAHKGKKLKEVPRNTRYYYGAQVPVLSHEPFDRNKPSTWIRRHPRPARMNERGEIVEQKVIHRYKRMTVQEQLDNTRNRISVLSTYSSGRNTMQSEKPEEPKKPKTELKKKKSHIHNKSS